MSKSVRFAFQGGGARLALLLPVVQAILECEDEEIIRVTRVAGTSAGAVAAALVAGKANMNALIPHLRTIATKEPEKLRAIFPPVGNGWFARWKLFFKVIVRNKTIASEKKFADFLHTCLRVANISSATAIGKMRIPCKIIATDISTKEHAQVSDTTSLLQLLLDSTALPFVFRNHGSKLDGGLIDNIPIEHLTADAGDDRVLAVGFDEDAYALPSDNAFSLAASLLDAAISSKTRATKRIVHPNYVLSLSPDAGDGITVNSFDIEGFIEFIKSENAYRIRVVEAKNWIQRQVLEAKEGDDRITFVPKNLGRTDETAKQLRATLDSIGKISRYYHEHDNITVVHSAFDVIAFSLRDPTKNDLVRFTDRFRIVSGSLNIYVTQFFSSNTSQGTVSTRFEIFDNQRRPIEFALLEVPQPGELAKACVIVFGKPLTSEGPDAIFTIIQEQESPAVMGPLAEYGADYLCAEVVQSPTAQQVEIGLAVPKDFGVLSLESGTADRLRKLSVHIDEQGDLNAPYKDGQPIPRAIIGVPSDFETYGWAASNISRREQVRVLFRRQRA